MSSKTALNINLGLKKAEICKCDNYLAGTIQNIQTLFEGKQFCDVTLISREGECQVEAHRVVLAAASKFFLGMFGGSLREASDKEVKLSQVDGHSLKVIINFIYSASIELSTETVENIIKSAHFFELNSLEELCCDFIAKRLDTSNCIGIALFAEQYSYKSLYATAETFVCQNFMKIRNNEEFFSLDPDQLGKLLSSDELSLPSEEEVFYSLMSWVEHDKINREEFIGKLLHHIRFPLLLPKFIAGTVELSCTSIESERLICKAYKWHLLPAFRLTLFSEVQSKLRNFKDMIIAISGWNSTEHVLNVGLFYPALREWIYREWPGLPERRTLFGSTTLKEKLIIAGGRLPSRDVTDRVDCLDLRTLKWTKLPPLLTKRHSLAMTTLNGNVYAVGGQDGFSALNSIEKWDPLKNEWLYVSPMRETNASPRVASRFNMLCVYREQHARKGRNRTAMYLHDAYDTANDCWTYDWLSTEGTILGMGTVSVVTTEYFIVVSRTAVTRYNPGIKSSVTIPINTIPPEYTDCAVFGHHIIVYGGNEFQEYLPFQNEWKLLPRFTNTKGKVIVILN